MREVTLFGRVGCHLCDDARDTLQRLREELAFVLVERDIEEEEALLRAYFERIPVILLDGREVGEFFVDEDLLRRELGQPLGESR